MTLCKIKKRTPHHATGGYLGRSYPEGGPKKSSLGGPFRHLKFGKNGLMVVGGNVVVCSTIADKLCFRGFVLQWWEGTRRSKDAKPYTHLKVPRLANALPGMLPSHLGYLGLLLNHHHLQHGLQHQDGQVQGNWRTGVCWGKVARGLWTCKTSGILALWKFSTGVNKKPVNSFINTECI